MIPFLNEFQTAHTILLVQPKASQDSKTYSDYETVKDCLEGKNRDNNLVGFLFQILKKQQETFCRLKNGPLVALV